MSRIQLALNVSDLDDAIGFYSTLFGTPPRKVRPGYANFAIAEPPLKLVLVEGEGSGGSINHLGVEVDSTDDVAASINEIQAAGLPADVRTAELCCHAVQDKVWTAGPDGERWEVYTVLQDESEPAAGDDGLPLATACC
ncbi:MAG: ArsI/CadI family heavy metal resistance metalloenzyme [Nitriliruptorales bacterium]|nr:ArsI/CadI family heavy metal resistance metalloenzyme [Nitriliruptorales bacterium]